MFTLFFSINGRIRRATFWYAFGFVCLAFVILFLFLDTLAGRANTLIIYPLFYWCAFAVCVKRYHDLDRSAWCLLLLLLPLVGPLWVAFELLCRGGKSGVNRYGPNPRVTDLDYHTVR